MTEKQLRAKTKAGLVRIRKSLNERMTEIPRLGLPEIEASELRRTLAKASIEVNVAITTLSRQQ